MAETKLSDLAFVPEDFMAYGVRLSTEKSALFQSGAVANVPALVPSAGKTMAMPRWKDLAGSAEDLADSAGLTVNAITSENEVAVIRLAGKAYGANDLVAVLAGADPLGALAGQVSNFWAREYNRTAVAVLTGAIETDQVNDISGGTGAAAVFSPEAYLDTKQKWGDNNQGQKIALMNSATYTLIKKLDLIDYIPNSQGRATETYMGDLIVVDDHIAVTTGVTSTYILDPGAIGFADGSDAAKYFETDRDIKAGSDFFTTRARFTMHVAGSSFTGSPAGAGATLTELATGSNWTRLVDLKDAPVVALKHKLA